MLCEDFPAVRFDLAECDGSHAGSFEAETESANSAEEIEDMQGDHRRRLLRCGLTVSPMSPAVAVQMEWTCASE
jgi:hypothetical protein